MWTVVNSAAPVVLELKILKKINKVLVLQFNDHTGY